MISGAPSSIPAPPLKAAVMRGPPPEEEAARITVATGSCPRTARNASSRAPGARRGPGPRPPRRRPLLPAAPAWASTPSARARSSSSICSPMETHSPPAGGGVHAARIAARQPRRAACKAASGAPSPPLRSRRRPTGRGSSRPFLSSFRLLLSGPPPLPVSLPAFLRFSAPAPQRLPAKNQPPRPRRSEKTRPMAA